MEIKKDLPILQELVNSKWSKENKLSEIKTELVAVERKIQLSITPETKEEIKNDEREDVALEDISIKNNNPIRYKM